MIFARPGGAAVALATPFPQVNENPPFNSPAFPLTAKQKRKMLKAQFDKMKEQAKDLVQLAQSLQSELDKSNQDILSLQIVDKADQVEKLAKKIKSEATEY